MYQMMPLNWLSLSLVFMILFLTFNSLNYFCFMYQPKTSLYLSKKNEINWMW